MTKRHVKLKQIKDVENFTTKLKMHGKYPAAYIVNNQDPVKMKPEKRRHKVALKMSKFKKLQVKLEREGKSKDAAADIAGAIGIKKFGKKGMAKKAALGRKKAEERKSS